MSSSDAFWLNFWGIVAAIGFIIVIIGVIIEGVEHFKKFPKKEHARKLHIEKIGWFLVVGGLAMEFLGDHAAKRISDREDARVKNEAGDAMAFAANSASNSVQVLAQVAGLNKEAADARKDAGEAMKSASKLDAARAEAEKETALIRSNNLALQLSLQPRIITAEQITNFIFLTQYLTKLPVRVEIGEMREETFNYARQIRYTLNRAGFQTPDIDTNALEGVFSDPNNVVYQRAIGDTNQWTDVVCFLNFTENYNFHVARANGLNLPYADVGDTNQTCEAICFALREDKITLERMGNTNSSKGIQLTIFVRQKPQ